MKNDLSVVGETAAPLRIERTSSLGTEKKEGGLCRPPPPHTPHSLSCARRFRRSGATVYYGTRILLLSIVTAARAKALPDRLAAVFIVMLE